MTTAKADKSFLAPRSHLFYNLAILIAGFLIFVFIPLFFLTPGQTKEFLDNGRELQVVGDMLVLVAIFFVCLAAYYWLTVLLRIRAIGATHIMFIFCWVTLSGFIFPLTSANGMLELRHAPTNVTNLVIVMILSTFGAILFVSRFSKALQIFFAILLTVSILTTAPRALSEFEKQNISDNVVKLSVDQNLLVVSFDGMPGHIVKSILNAKADLSNAFSDFTYFENVYASAPATQGSLQGIVYGNHDFTDPENRTWMNVDDLYFNQSDEVNLTTGFHYNVYNRTGNKLSAGQFGTPEQRNELFELYRNVAVRITSSFGVNIMDVIDRTAFRNRKGKFFFTVEGFDKVVDTMRVESDKPSVFYAHFTFTHWPPRVDESCTDKWLDPVWTGSNKNKTGIIAGSNCGLKKYAELISKLKSLGIYDNTTVILLSDHGMMWPYYSEPPHNLKVNNSRSLGFDRYFPFLMIKPAGQQSDVLSYSQKYVILDDLAKTACAVFEAATKCDEVPGLNLLNDESIAPDSFYIHVVKDENSSWSAVDHKAVKIKRGVPLLQAMQDSAEIEISEPE